MAITRWGVIGAGGIARRRTIPEGILAATNATLTAVYSPRSGLEIAKQFGVRAVATEGELYNEDIDAVYIATPVDCHRYHVERAAAAGHHVLCEKPLALNVDDAEHMVTACEKAGVIFGVGFMMRHHAHHRRAAEMVQGGAIGKPVYARAQLSCWYPPRDSSWRQDPQRSGGGTLPDLASHCIDLVEFILGSSVRSVICRKASLVHHYPVEDTTVVLLEFSNGAMATVDCLFNVPDESIKNRLEVYGSGGSLLAEGTVGQTQSGTLEWIPGFSGSYYDAEQQRVEPRAATTFPLPKGNLYRDQIEDFSDAIQQRRSPFVTGRQGLWIQKVLAGCDRSSEQGTLVPLELSV